MSLVFGCGYITLLLVLFYDSFPAKRRFFKTISAVC